MSSAEMVASTRRSSVFGTADPTLAERLAREAERYTGFGVISPVADFTELRRQLAIGSPRVVLVDEEILAGTHLADSLRELTAAAPVILVAGAAPQNDVAKLVVEGDLDFVMRAGDFAALAVSLVERRLRWAERSETPLGAPWTALPPDTAIIFRHEINNPLTGILGNAELVLSHRDRIPPADRQRLQTIVDLAVRLRETTRRLSNTWESQAQSLKSA